MKEGNGQIFSNNSQKYTNGQYGYKIIMYIIATCAESARKVHPDKCVSQYEGGGRVIAKEVVRAGKLFFQFTL